MIERKPSFFERLTGIEKFHDEPYRRTTAERADTNGELTPKPWLPAVDEDAEAKHGVIHEHIEIKEEEEDTDNEEDATLAIDMHESDNELIIHSMIAGITPENLHISITRDTVTLSGRRITPNNVPEDRYLTRELYWGAFSRVIALPYEVDTDGADAVEKYGLLTIRLPKLDTHRTQELKVKSVQ